MENIIKIETELLEELKCVCPDGNCDCDNLKIVYKNFFEKHGFSHLDFLD